MKTWILVANASRAKLFEVHFSKFLNDQEELKLLKEYQHPESRERDTDLITDKFGNYHGKGEGHGTFVEQTDPHEHEPENFALQLVHELEAGRVAGAHANIILVAPPTFYGLMHKHMHTPLQNDITRVIEKDYTLESFQTLEKHLKQQIG